MIAGMAISLTLRFGEWRRSKQATAAASLARTWRGTAVTALAISLALGIAAGVAARADADHLFRNAFVFLANVRASLVNGLFYMLSGAIVTALAASSTAGILGALAGALGGAAGADVERRLVPNQGIRQSAVNILIFSALGVLIIGLPYGLFNLTVLAITTWMLPSPFDWLRAAGGAGVTFGILAGLLPGAACIQHLVLRFVFWADGRLPLRLATFLNLATSRRLLQRVGGRYRFIHDLLRDHLGATARARTPA
jgi:hypothetical protein